MTAHRDPVDTSSPSLISRAGNRLKPIWFYATAWPGLMLESLRFWKDLPYFRGSRDMFDILQTTKEFVKDEVAGFMGLDPATHVQMELPRFGSATFVLILSAEGKKAILRAYPMVERHRAAAHVEATELMVANGINVPKVLFSALDGKRYPVAFAVDEYIEGEMLAGEQLTAQNIDAMALQIARMHQVKSKSWGRVSAERPQPFFLGLTKRVKRDLDILKNRGLLNDGEVRDMQEWVARWQPEFEARTDFSLTHNDILPANGLFTPDGQYYMIDLNRLQWDVPAREVVRCYYRMFRGEQSAIDEFNRAYFSHLPAEQAKETWRFCRFYEVFYRMSALVKMTPKLKKKSKKLSLYEERQRLMLAEMLELVRRPHDEILPLPTSNPGAGVSVPQGC